MTQSSTVLPAHPDALLAFDLGLGILSLSRDMINICGFDGVMRDVNPAWEQTLGYTKDELLGRSSIDLVHPDDQASTLDAAKLLAEGVPLMAFANRLRGKDGSYRWIQSNAIADLAKQVVYSVGFVDTERTLSQSDQLKAGALQRAIFNSANFSSIATDAKGVIQIFNVGAERMLGYTAADVMNITPEAITGKRKTFAEALARQIVMTLWAESHSLQSACEIVGRIHHTSAVYARAKILSQLQYCENTRERVRKIMQKYSENILATTNPEP